MLAVAHAYGAATGLELSQVSWRALGDTKKLGALEQGADIQVGRYERVMQWFSDHWPADAEWPDGVARPQTASLVPSDEPVGEAVAS